MQEDEITVNSNEIEISPNFVDLRMSTNSIQGTIMDSIKQEKIIYQNNINRKKQKFYGKIRARRINK